MASHLTDALTVHSEALAAWTEARTKATQIEDPRERAAALQALKAERPSHPYVSGISLAAVWRGNRRLLSPVQQWMAGAVADRADVLAVLAERRAKAVKIEDPEKRAAALEELRGEKPLHPVLIAAGCTVVAAVVTWPMLHGHHTVAVATALTVWLLAALVAGQKPASAQASKVTAEEGAEDDQEDAEEGSEESVPTAAETHALVAAQTARGTSLLLTVLAAALASRHPSWEGSTKAVRALLAEAGIPVRAGVRTPAGNGPGIHHQDVPPLPSPTSAAPGGAVVANVGAGQSANANANNTESATSGEGFVLAPDPDNPARTIVIHKAA